MHFFLYALKTPLILVVIISILLPACDQKTVSKVRTHKVFVTINPQKFLVQRIAGDTLQVGLLIPAGVDMHNFEPTPQQILELNQVDVWFRIGESIESKVLEAIKSHKSQIEVVDIQQGLPLISMTASDHHSNHHTHSSAEGYDVHTWLNPQLLKEQAITIANSLKIHYPESAILYQKNLEKLLTDIDALHCEIKELLSFAKGKYLLVSHAAFTYFCQEYGLKQLSLEYEGKDPTVKQLSKILDKAHKYQLKLIFVEENSNDKGAYLVAQHIGAKVVEVKPLGFEVLDNLRFIAEKIALEYRSDSEMFQKKAE
ncbi:MAG: hypothetical protein K0S74_1871 [Chlamydiales bacterium]|jgi:zinc transport system substrate-binding protein|nr:hypothetical protein [Chlamydiales bacterium]